MLGLLVLGAVIGGMAVEYWLVTRGVATTRAQAPVDGDVAAEVKRLSSLLPTQSHTMKDVADHWVNLWFAAEKRNWPLAKFYFDQARTQAKWTAAIRPERVLPDGNKIDVQGLMRAADMGAFAAVEFAIEDEKYDEFVTTYKEALGTCHSCHTAVGMPFLRPTVPTVKPATIVPFEPAGP
jgi:hypothetical protein